MNNYRVLVPVLLELEVETSLGPADALAAVTDLFANQFADPLLGANLRTGSRPLIARTRGVALNGRAYLTDPKP